MRRIFICLLLSFAIPVQGFASMAAFACTCPMSHPLNHPAAMQMAMDDSADDAAMPDCCKHHDQNTCKDCKGGQQCHPSTSWQYFGSALAFQVPAIQPAVWLPRVAQFIPSFDPSSVWRPPALS